MPQSPAQCPAQHALLFIGGRWKVPILYHLRPCQRRFSELRRLLAPVTPRMLAQQLRELERDGLVRRKLFAQVPPKVEYSLTTRGKTVLPIIAAMCRWGKQNR